MPVNVDALDIICGGGRLGDRRVYQGESILVRGRICHCSPLLYKMQSLQHGIWCVTVIVWAERNHI